MLLVGVCLGPVYKNASTWDSVSKAVISLSSHTAAVRACVVGVAMCIYIYVLYTYIDICIFTSIHIHIYIYGTQTDTKHHEFTWNLLVEGLTDKLLCRAHTMLQTVTR